MVNQSEFTEYEKHYSDVALFGKVAKLFSKLGSGLLNKVFTLWFALKDKDTPTWAKTVIIGALGYFILPIDAIPDIIPIFGFSDDLTALISATTIVWTHIKPEHSQHATEQINKIFGRHK